jgi:tetratricopeptide (TPR) repeat protein
MRSPRGEGEDYVGPTVQSAPRQEKGHLMSRYPKAVLAIALLAPACDGLVCSQQRIRAMEITNKGIEAFNNGLQDAAERELKLAIQTDPTYVLAYYNLGKVYQKQRKWDRAIEAFTSATERDPGNANYHYDLGEAAFEAKRFDRAEQAFKKATEVDPKLPKAHWRLGLIYSSLDRAKEADASLRKAIEVNPHLDKPFVALGHLYLDYDAANEAKQVFSECARINDTSAECHNGHGLALKELRQYDQAAAEFKKALELEPSLTTAVYNIGMTYADWYAQSGSNEHKERAREYLEKFVKGGGGRDGGVGYVKAASDKLYALSGT